jgi:hypothetical protein
MKWNSLFRPILAVTLALIAPAIVARADTPTSDKSAKRALEKGMSTDDVLAIVGKPADVIPMGTDGKAERWVYRREIGTQIVQTANTYTTEPRYIGSNMDGPMVADVKIPDYRLKRVTVYQVTALLMFEGKLVIARQWRENDERYVN